MKVSTFALLQVCILLNTVDNLRRGDAALVSCTKIFSWKTESPKGTLFPVRIS